MSKTDTIKELYKAGTKTSEIAKAVGLTPQRINQILKGEGLKQDNFDYSPKITEQLSGLILSLHKQGENTTFISKAVNLTPPAIRSFLQKKDLKPNIKISNRERPCVVCGTLFAPIYSDGVKKDKYKTCSSKCSSQHISNIKTKYTQEEINRVVELQNSGYGTSEICKMTKVDINKVKEIIKDSKQ